MAVEYKILTQDEMDEFLATTLACQERDHYCHSLDKQRYEAMLPEMAEGESKARVAKLLAEVNSRLSEIELIHAKLTPQLPAKARLDAAVTRLKNKNQL